MKAPPRDVGGPPPTQVAPSPQSLSCAAASGDPALIPHVTAWAGCNEAGVMGEKEAPLRSLHFLELMTSMRAAGTGPQAPSGSFRAHHSLAGTQRGGAGGREGLGEAGAISGEAWHRKWEQGEIPQCLQAPCCGSFSLPLSLLSLISFFITPFTRGGHTKIQSFTRSSYISIYYN